MDERLVNTIKHERHFPTLKESHNIQKQRGGYLKKEEVKSEHSFAPKKKSLQFRTYKGEQQELRKGGQFGKHKPESIVSHTGATLNEAKFLVTWMQSGNQKPQNSYHPFTLIMQWNPELLLNYFENHDQYIMID